MKTKNIYIPSCNEFRKGCKEYVKYEKRDAMYRVATFLVSHFWNKHSGMTDGLGVLLLTWNQGFYRYGPFDFDKLEKCIKDNFKDIAAFRRKDISSLTESDRNTITKLFCELLNALEICSGKGKGRKSPVSVSKTLHLLAPKFFPLWDYNIAKAYGYYYYKNSEEKYFAFSKIVQNMSSKLKNCDYVKNSNRSILKLIDEYNYSKHTKGWI